MRRFFLFIPFLAVSLSLSAQLDGDGFYRLQNNYTGRYVHLRDGYGRVDVSSTDADMSAVQTRKPYGNSLSDPASILYITSVPAADGYDLHCQGTSLYSIINYYVKMKQNGSFYQAYAERSGYTLYLVDAENEGADYSCLAKFKGGMKASQRDWLLHPVKTDDDNYLGVLPSISYNGKYYTGYYVSFPYSFFSSGMKAFYITTVDASRGIAVYKDVTTSDVPAATPVFLECSSSQPFDNRLNVHTSNVAPVSDNLLKGVYFCRVMISPSNPHNFFVKNDTATIRVLGLKDDGSLGFVKSNDTYLPENSSYLTVPAKSPSEFTLMTPDEYSQILTLNPVSSEIKSVRYFNVIGQELTEPSEGVVIVVTTYCDGHQSKEKTVYRP